MRASTFGNDPYCGKPGSDSWSMMMVIRGSPLRTFGNGLGETGHEIAHRKALHRHRGA
jgi:hypothetical protein